MDESVLVELEGSILKLILNRPDRVNALNGTMHASLIEALQSAATNQAVRVIHLSGAGRGFCAGQDLSEVEVGRDLGHALEHRYNPLVRLFRSLPQPVIAAVHGVAAGAGANLALACDIVVAGESARFLQAFVRIGLIPDAGGTWFLPRLVGEARARAMAMLGEPITAQQAEAWGLIWRTLPDDDLLPGSMKIAHQLAALPSESMRLMKQAFAASSANTLDQQLDVERDLQREAGRTDDFQEGVQAFLDKRPPVFKGAPR